MVFGGRRAFGAKIRVFAVDPVARSRDVFDGTWSEDGEPRACPLGLLWASLWAPRAGCCIVKKWNIGHWKAIVLEIKGVWIHDCLRVENGSASIFCLALAPRRDASVEEV